MISSLDANSRNRDDVEWSMRILHRLHTRLGCMIWSSVASPAAAA